MTLTSEPIFRDLQESESSKPAALSPRDPAPTRQIILKLHVAKVRGRAAMPRM